MLAESASPVLVFETRLPTRYYIELTNTNFDHLYPTKTVTACPYKGTTGGYWSARIPDPRTGSETIYEDLAWMYGFPTRQLLPISGLIFYNERVDTYLEGQLLPRPKTTSSRSRLCPKTPVIAEVSSRCSGDHSSNVAAWQQFP
jgi:uncharacterized protein (DUF427 family)